MAPDAGSSSSSSSNNSMRVSLLDEDALEREIDDMRSSGSKMPARSSSSSFHVVRPQSRTQSLSRSPSTITSSFPSSWRARWLRAFPLHRSVYLLCVSGFLMSFKPSEPFLTHYLLGYKGLSEEEVNDLIYPVWTYAYLACLLPVGVLAHMFGPRVVCIVGFAARLATRLLLLWVGGVRAMQFMQFTFGLASACEPVFYALIYVNLPRGDFVSFTGYQQGAILAGHLSAGLLGQALVSSGAVAIRVLFVISAVSVTMATILFLCIRFPKTQEEKAAAVQPALLVVQEEELEDADADAAGQPLSANDFTDASASPPPASVVHSAVGRSVEMRPQTSSSASSTSPFSPTTGRISVISPQALSSPDDTDVEESWIEIIRVRGVRALGRELLSEYARPSVLYWSLWWWVGRSVTEFVLNYNTTLFYERAPDIDYDGVVIAVGRGVAGVAGLLPAYTGIPLGFRAFSLLSVTDFLAALLLFLSAVTQSVYFDYVLFVTFYGLVQFLYSMASAAVAGNVSSSGRCTLVFTANTFLSLAFQTVTQTVVGHNVLHLKPQGKYYVISVQMLGLAAVFALAAFFTAGKAIHSYASSAAWLGQAAAGTEPSTAKGRKINDDDEDGQDADAF